VLASSSATTEQKAKALLSMGKMQVNEGNHQKSLAYFERVYVIYGKYRELVSQAYFLRGEALEKLALLPQAYEVYAELVARPDLETFPEVRKARKKLSELKQHAPPPSEGLNAEEAKANRKDAA
ncbi:MAG: hypothetical protein AAF191_11705, partial [Verrucomicrobiota bacterium]